MRLLYKAVALGAVGVTPLATPAHAADNQPQDLRTTDAATGALQLLDTETSYPGPSQASPTATDTAWPGQYDSADSAAGYGAGANARTWSADTPTHGAANG